MQQLSSASAKLTGKPRSRSSLPCRSEYQEQVAIFAWAEIALRELPDLEMLIGSMNGAKRSPRTAGLAKRMGLKAGYPDLTLLVPRKPFYGLLVELKRRKGGTVSPEQAAWIANLQRNGYRAVICRGSDEAINEITSYLRGLYS